MINKFFKFFFALVAASIAAAISGALAVVIAASLYGAAPAASIFTGIQFFAKVFFLFSLPIFAPLQIVLSWRGNSGRIAHIIAAAVVLLALLLGQSMDTRETPPLLDQLTSLAPALPAVLFAALVSGRTFTSVMNAPQKLELWQIASALIWFAALYVASQRLVTPAGSGAHWPYHSEFTREPIRGAWYRYGEPLLLLLGGVGAFLACLRPRLSLAFFAAALAMPLSFGLWFRLTPTGPENPSFTLGNKGGPDGQGNKAVILANRTFSLDWRLEPLIRDNDEFSFVAEKSGPWRIASSPGANNRITISTNLARLDTLDDGYSWERSPYEKEGLSCRDGRFERRPNDLAVVCEAKTADGHVRSHVMCELGYCSHHFRSGDLHYWLHYARDDFPKWRAFETETVAYVDRAARGELRDVLKNRKCPITYRCPEDAWLDNPGTKHSEAANSLPRPPPR